MGIYINLYEIYNILGNVILGSFRFRSFNKIKCDLYNSYQRSKIVKYIFETDLSNIKHFGVKIFCQSSFLLFKYLLYDDLNV